MPRVKVMDTAWIVKHACDADLCLQFSEGMGVRNLTLGDMETVYKKFQRRENKCRQ